MNGAAPAMGRPTCAVLPESINAGRTAMSSAVSATVSIRERATATRLFAVPGPQLAAVESLAIIVRANDALEQFHRGRARLADPSAPEASTAS